MKSFLGEEQAIIDKQLSIVWFVASSASPENALTLPARNSSSYPYRSIF
jgi:hypothetical protein